ncbi:hypothetical protein [Neoroseomonas rubea]|uniref:hypothetical protein n=1 Tax=Neoroseomonas rubea TaxID=2748666 RepID=UPI0018E05A9D|nr:hypothetical protein [Roseomonas rubea]
MPGAQRVREHDQQVGPDEGEVVVPAIPEQDVGLRLGGRDDAGVVHAREDRLSGGDVGLVFLSFLDRAGGGVEVGGGGEALHRLRRQVAIGHRMAQHGHAQPARTKPRCEPACHLRLAAARAHGADGDDGPAGRQHRRARPRQHEVRACREHHRTEPRHMHLRHVAVGEQHLVDVAARQQRGQFRLVVDWYAIRIEWAGEGGRVAPPRDARDLRRGEGDAVPRWILAEQRVEDVEVAPRRAKDDRAAARGHGAKARETRPARWSCPIRA